MHGGATRIFPGPGPDKANLIGAGGKSLRRKKGSAGSAGGGLPKLEGQKDRGGLGALAAADAVIATAAAAKRKAQLGFECHHKYDASPLFTEKGAEALKKKAALQTTKRDESTGPAGALGGGHPFSGGGGMVSATDGLKQAILSGQIVSQDGTVHQSAIAELQGPTSWSGQDGENTRTPCPVVWACHSPGEPRGNLVEPRRGVCALCPHCWSTPLCSSSPPVSVSVPSCFCRLCVVKLSLFLID